MSLKENADVRAATCNSAIPDKALMISSANPSLPGSNVTFTATLNAVAPGAGVPSGSVRFLADGSAIGSPLTGAATPPLSGVRSSSG